MKELIYRTSKLVVCLMLFIGSTGLYAQTDSTRIRIADTLSAEQKKSHNRVLLRSELDSLLKLYSKPVEPQQQIEPTNTVTETPINTATWPVLIGLGITLLLLVYGIYRTSKHTQRITNTLERQKLHIEQLLLQQQNSPAGAAAPVKPEPVKGGTQKSKLASLETKILEQTRALEKLTAENEQLMDDVKDMAGFKTMYQEVVEGITKTFKVKHYSPNGEGKSEHELLMQWLDTERAFTTNVYEKYVKPVHTILDANKKDPAHTPADEKNRLAELLVSVSLLYMEYLYLRVAELSIGGKIVDRINLIKKASAINASTLKQLDVEHGSKALVLHLALREKNIGPLSYPVLDETNLNRK
jgi:hypothetical protein